MTNTKQGNSNTDQGQQQGKTPSRSELETIIRQGRFNSQSEANSYLQQHGMTCQLRDDGTAEVFDSTSSNKLATVRLQGTGDSRSISSIDY